MDRQGNAVMAHPPGFGAPCSFAGAWHNVHRKSNKASRELVQRRSLSCARAEFDGRMGRAGRARKVQSLLYTRYSAGPGNAGPFPGPPGQPGMRPMGGGPQGAPFPPGPGVPYSPSPYVLVPATALQYRASFSARLQKTRV